MSEVHDWSQTAASNNTAPPDGSPEGMSPAAVNNAIREVMAALKRLYDDTRGGLTSAGSGNGYTLTTNTAATSLSDLPVLAFQVDRTNPSDGPTLDVDGLGTRNMQMNGVNLKAGQLKQDTVVIAAYNSASDTFAMFGAEATKQTTLQESTSDPTATEGEGSLYVKDHEGNTELFYQDGQGNVIRLTNNGELATDLKNTDAVFASLRTLSFSRGKVIDVPVDPGAAPSGNDLAIIDWSQATVFRLSINAETDLDFRNMPDTSVDEEQTIYVDVQTSGQQTVHITSDFTVIYPSGGPERGPTADGRDLYLATSDDGQNVMVVPMLDMKANP